jgi:hypothetical protein
MIMLKAAIKMINECIELEVQIFQYWRYHDRWSIISSFGGFSK